MKTLILFLLFASRPACWADDNNLKNRASDKVDEVEYDRDALANQSWTEKKIIPVCSKVRRKLKSMSQGSWTYRQASLKHSSSKYKANEIEKVAFEKFKNKPRLSSFWVRDEVGFHYFRQIRAETKCLQCHGEKSKLLPGIEDKSSKDLSMNFKDGELMGVYSVQKKGKAP